MRDGRSGEASSRAERLVIAVAIAWLIARLLFLAFRIDPAIPPDEITHVGQALHATAFAGPPRDTPASWQYGLVSQRPFLYAWTLARWLALRPDAIPVLPWLRLANGALALATLLTALAWARRAGAGPLARALFVVVLTNWPMWSFLAAAVSYDNLGGWLATLAFALAARTLDEADPRALLGMLAALAAAALTKTALLPVAALLGVALAAAAWLDAGARRALAEALRGLRRPTASIAALGLLSLGLALGSLWLYGGNLWRHGVLEPAANQVLPLEAARRNRIFAQEYVLRSYRAGAISHGQALRELRTIAHPGDRAGALWMLERARALREARAAGRSDGLAGRLGYAPIWIRLMAERNFGVMGHRALYKSGPLALAYGLVAIAALAALTWRALRRTARARDVHIRIAAAVSALYALVLMQLVNFPIYRVTGLEVEAVQGRYLFPVLPVLIAASVIALIDALPARARVPVACAIGALFVLGDFPYLLWRADDAWFAASALLGRGA